MIISFFGHSKFYGADLSVEFVIEQIKEVAGETDVQFFLGDYGGFDAFAYQCAMEYKKMRPLTKLCFVSPYLDEEYLRRRYVTERFDEVIYPDIEATPKRYAITARNRWMVENSDFIFFYVNIRFGGAYSALQYARRKNVKHHNFYNLQN